MSSLSSLTSPSTASPNDLITELSEIQTAAARVQSQRKALIALDERRQKLREAETTLRKSKVQGANTWICLGPSTFMEFPTTTAAKFLADDRKVVEDTITETNTDIHKSLNDLLKLEGSKDLQDLGFDLQPIKEASRM